MKSEKHDKLSEAQQINNVRIEFTDKPLTAWGGIATLMGKYLEQINFRQWVEENVPIEEKSNNGRGIYEKVIGQFITVLSGGSRFSHLLWWIHGKEIFQKIFKVSWLPSASTTLTRFWNKIKNQKLAEILGNAARKLTRCIITWDGIKEDNVNFDSSVITRYGHQEGAKRGYNPKKKGRPSHNPQIAFLSSGYVVNLWNRSGDASSGNGIVDYFKQTITTLGTDFTVKRILCDTGYYLVEFITHLETNGYSYIIAVPIIEQLQKQIYRIKEWQFIDKGIEIAEFYFEHFDKKWTHPRRYVVVRQETNVRPQATGKQPSLFKELDEWKSYRFSLMITDDEQSTPEQIWREYRPRAQDENVIKDLKEGYSLDTFNLKNFWATEAVLVMITLVFHNLVHYLNRKVINLYSTIEHLKTLRLKYFIIPAQLGTSGGYSTLRLGVTDKKLQDKLKLLLEKIHQFSDNFKCIAVEPIFDTS
jgi:hypothetical protein